MSITADNICKQLVEMGHEYSYSGDSSFEVEGVCSLTNPKQRCVTWVKSDVSDDIRNRIEKYDLLIVCKPNCSLSCSENNNLIVCSNPKELFFSIVESFFFEKACTGISEQSHVETQIIGEGVSIGFGCFICRDVQIGNNVTIDNNVVISCPTTIGDHAHIHSGVVIGTDGFGYYMRRDGSPGKVPHIGGVSIGSDVEIGANTCIDRGTIDDTVIGDRVKIDNLVHIGHNVIIEEDALVIAQSMLGGSCHIGKNGYIAPCAAIMNQADIGSRSLVGMGAVVTKDVAEGKVVAGVPAKVLRDNI